jgi:hypothetical protein
MKVAYVLEGDYTFRVGDAVLSASTCAVVVIPRGSHHTFTTSTGRLLFVCGPSGNEEMFLDFKALGADPDPKQVTELIAQHETVFPAGDQAAPWRPAH